jgi:ABC-type Fe3+/spermidine/putrescine transport system ATPase subunit
MPKEKPLLVVSKVSKQKGERFILNKVGFEQHAGEKVAIVGETGSGKTTLLKIISGLLQADSGGVLLNGAPVQGPEEQLVPGHPSIAYLSQHFELQKFLKVYQVLQYANGLTEPEATSIYEVCRVDHLLQRKTDELSGGEKQRIAIARLLVGKPKLLLLDEPFSNLDFIHRNILKDVVAGISDKLKITCLMVSHDPVDTLPWADRIFVMREGRFVQDGKPEAVYRQPKNEYVAGLFGLCNRLSIAQAKALGVKSKQKIVRPEQLELIPKRKGNPTGLIMQVNYYGSHYEMEVSFMKNVFYVTTEVMKYKVGDVVGIRLKRKD